MSEGDTASGDSSNAIFSMHSVGRFFEEFPRAFAGQFFASHGYFSLDWLIGWVWVVGPPVTI